jgi:cation:H+ antiporter
MYLWAGFILLSAVIFFSGYRLSLYGDIIAEKTGMGRTWIGLMLLATVTSLPELFTGISSVTVAGVPNIAVGDVLGSCAFNMLILSFLDALVRKVPVSAKAHQGNVLAAAFGILLLSIVAGGLYASKGLVPGRWIGPSTLMNIPIDFIAIRLVFSYEKRHIAALIKEQAAELRYQDVSLRSAVTKYALNALAVIMAAVFLPYVGVGIAETTGLGKTFVGNIFIALTTSLPEVVVSMSAVRIGAVDLAIGNLFGSNIFNILILAIDDILFIQGPILSHADTNHIIPAVSAIAMTAIAIIGLTYRAARKPLFLAWDSMAIVLVFALNITLLYLLR